MYGPTGFDTTIFGVYDRFVLNAYQTVNKYPMQKQVEPHLVHTFWAHYVCKIDNNLRCLSEENTTCFIQYLALSYILFMLCPLLFILPFHFTLAGRKGGKKGRGGRKWEGKEKARAVNDAILSKVNRSVGSVCNGKSGRRQEQTGTGIEEGETNELLFAFRNFTSVRPTSNSFSRYDDWRRP